MKLVPSVSGLCLCVLAVIATVALQAVARKTLLTALHAVDLAAGFGEIETDQPALFARHTSAGSTGSQAQSSSRDRSMAAQAQSGGKVAAMVPCPFEVTPLPQRTEDIAADSHMTSVYVHESVVNCMLWGLYRSNMLKISVQDGKQSSED